MKGFAVLLLTTVLTSFSLYAEGPADVFKDTSLEVKITTRVLEEETEVVWNMESSEVTVSGETVTVKLNGDKVRVLAEITPYLLEDGSILLVARGDVLLSSEEEGMQYKTTMKSLPVDFGEKAFFFPLGVAFDSKENIYTIQLEIQVNEAPKEEDQEEEAP